jgi:hypothetical protein
MIANTPDASRNVFMYRGQSAYSNKSITSKSNVNKRSLSRSSIINT